MLTKIKAFLSEYLGPIIVLLIATIATVSVWFLHPTKVVDIKEKMLGGGESAAELFTTSLFNDANIVSYYRLSDRTDAKGNNHLVQNGGSFVAGKFGNAWRSGAKDVVRNMSTTSVTGFWNDTGSWSIVTWFRPDQQVGSGDYYNILTHCGTYNNESLAYQFNGSPQIGFIKVRNGIVDDSIWYTTTLPTSSWSHLAMTYDSTKPLMTGYVNGVAVISSTPPNSAGSSSCGGGQVFLGTSYAPAAGDISLDDTAFFSRTLTATEISNIYNGSPAPTVSKKASIIMWEE